MTWTRDRTVAIMAYRDWLSSPTTEKNTLLNSIRTKWYKIIESTPSKRYMEGPHTKFWENQSWELKSKAKKTGASEEVGRGIKKVSLFNILKRSAPIWKAPLRPIKVGPKRLMEYAKTLRSVNVTNSINKIVSKVKIKTDSLIL